MELVTLLKEETCAFATSNVVLKTRILLLEGRLVREVINRLRLVVDNLELLQEADNLLHPKEVRVMVVEGEAVNLLLREGEDEEEKVVEGNQLLLQDAKMCILISE